jgi:CheY-like chemotaxis protein
MSNFEGALALIIEDDDASIKVLEHLLGYLAVDVDVITDSFTIEDQLAQITRPDVIFLDLEMPQSNGYTVLEYIHNNPKLVGVPVVAYTTHISHLNQAKDAGFHSFLGKPLDGKRFGEHLEQILNGVPVWEVP